MTEQEISNAIQDIQASLANRWWQNAGFVLLGAVPSALVAYLNYRWNKNLFALTKEKEQVRILAGIVAEVKALQYRYWKTADEYIMKWAMFEFHKTIREKEPHGFRPEFKEKIVELRDESIKSADEMIEHETLLSKLLAEYNYLVKDKKIDELADAFRQTAPIGEVHIKTMPTQQLINYGVGYVIDAVRLNYYEPHKAALGNIVDYLMYGTDKSLKQANL